MIGALLVVAVVAVFSGCSTTSSDVNTTVYESNDQYNYYALFVGIADYPSCVGELQYTAKDADDFKYSVLNSTFWGSSAATLTLKNEEATKSNITRFVQLYKEKGNANTIFVMYFSGHGTNGFGDRAALVTYNPEEADYITDVELTTLLTGNPCNAAIYLDTCYSGGFINKDNGMNAKVYTGAEGYDPHFNKGWRFDTEDNRAISDVDRLVAVTASTGEEVSWESSSLESGVFTYFLVQGLSKFDTVIGPADANSDGTITVEESYNYLAPQVVTYSTDNLASVQTPQYVNNNAGNLVINSLTKKQSPAGRARSAGFFQIPVFLLFLGHHLHNCKRG